MQNPPVTFGALCAIHPERTARMTCRRCGNFMCDECSVGGSETLCPKCRQLAGFGAFPFDRNNVGFSELISHCWELFKNDWVMLSVAALILIGIGVVASVIGGVIQQVALGVSGKSFGATMLGQVFGSTFNAIVQGIFQLGFYRVCFDALEGKKVDLARMFTQMSKMGHYVVQVLVIMVAFVVPLAIYLGVFFLIATRVGHISTDPSDWSIDQVGPLVIAGSAIGAAIFIPLWVYFGLAIGFAGMELVYGDVGAIEGFRRAMVIAKGFRLWLIGYILVAFAVGLAGVFACCIGLIPATAFITLINTAFYFAIRNGSGLPQPAAG